MGACSATHKNQQGDMEDEDFYDYPLQRDGELHNRSAQPSQDLAYKIAYNLPKEALSTEQLKDILQNKSHLNRKTFLQDNFVTVTNPGKCIQNNNNINQEKQINEENDDDGIDNVMNQLQNRNSDETTVDSEQMKGSKISENLEIENSQQEKLEQQNDDDDQQQQLYLQKQNSNSSNGSRLLFSSIVNANNNNIGIKKQISNKSQTKNDSSFRQSVTITLQRRGCDLQQQQDANQMLHDMEQERNICKQEGDE